MTSVVQVGRTDLRLISPDTKQVLLHKSFREISHVARGQEEQVHFGFICKDGGQQSAGPGHYMGYIFRCDSTSVVDDIMQGLRCSGSILIASVSCISCSQVSFPDCARAEQERQGGTALPKLPHCLV